MGRTWGLFRVWCGRRTIGQDQVTPAVIAEFLTELGGPPSVVRVRSRQVCAVLMRQGWRNPDVAAVDWRDALAELEVAVPGRVGLAARRDGCLVAVVGGAGLPQATVAGLVPGDVTVDYGLVEVRGVMVPFDPAPERCGRCHVLLWLGVLGEYVTQHRTSVNEYLHATYPRMDPVGHFCRVSEDYVPGAWARWPVTVPGIDRYGWVSDVSLSPQAASQIWRRRTSAPAPAPHPPVAVAPGAEVTGHRRELVDQDGSLAQSLDALEAEIDALNARVLAVFEQAGT